MWTHGRTHGRTHDDVHKNKIEYMSTHITKNFWPLSMTKAIFLFFLSDKDESKFKMMTSKPHEN
jgi:hypothetical protein